MVLTPRTGVMAHSGVTLSPRPELMPRTNPILLIGQKNDENDDSALATFFDKRVSMAVNLN